MRTSPSQNALFLLLLVLSIGALAVLRQPGHQRDRSPLAPPQRAAQPAVTSPQLGESQVSITLEGESRVIRANGLPDHPTGPFPNRRNPNHIAPQNYLFRVPAQPRANEKPTPLRMNPFGVAVNGVVFDPGAAEWWDGDPRSGWQFEPMSGAINLGVDSNNAHVQPTGAYHYHSIPLGLIEQLTGGKPNVALLGWAADGFPIYGPWNHSKAEDPKSPLAKLRPSYRLKAGLRPGGPGGSYDGSFVEDYQYVKGAGDLDECNGRFGATPEFPAGTYYYVLTEDFPFIPRFFKGTPDPSFFRRSAPGHSRRGRPSEREARPRRGPAPKGGF